MSALLSEDSPLHEATRLGLLTPAGPYPGLRAYTTGLTEWRYESRSALYHEGNGVGTTTRMTILPDEGVGFFTQVNGEALVGTGDPSSQTLFIRDLHEMLVEELYPGPFSFDGTPIAPGNGRVVDELLMSWTCSRGCRPDSSIAGRRRPRARLGNCTGGSDFEGRTRAEHAATRHVGTTAVACAAFVLGSWSWAWHVLPV